MSHTHERQTANLLTALALAVQERVGAAAAATLPHGASAPAALVALESTLAGGTIDALRRVLGLTHSGTVRLVDRLAAAGLVERRVGPDARSVSLSLTPGGRRAARRVLAAREAAAEELLSALAPSDRAQLTRLLGQVMASAAATPEDARRVCRLCDVAVCLDGRRPCPMRDLDLRLRYRDEEGDDFPVNAGF